MDIEMRKRVEAACLSALEEAGVTPVVHHHPPVYTVEEARALRGNIAGAHVKNLFLCDRKKRQFWLLTAIESQPIQLKALASHLGVAKGLRFANEGHLQEYLGVTPGAVTPLAVMNDTSGRVTMLLDNNVLGFDAVSAHPLHNAATFTLKVDELMHFLAHRGHAPTLLDLDGINAPGT